MNLMVPTEEVLERMMVIRMVVLALRCRCRSNNLPVFGVARRPKIPKKMQTTPGPGAKKQKI
jgi:hypothetical protein